MALIGLSMVNNLVLAVAINTGRLDSLAAALPPEEVEVLRSALVETEPSAFLAGGVERIAAIALHVGLSVLVLWGVHHGRRLPVWVVAVLVHTAANLSAVLALRAGAPVWLIEAFLLVWGAAVILLALRLRRGLPTGIEPDLPDLPAPDPGQRRP